jgi:hypothetical protein
VRSTGRASLTSSPVLVTLDMDRTLIYSANAITQGAPDALRAEVLLAAARCVELYQGKPQSYMSGAAIASLMELDRIAQVVPTTTRTIEQYRRIELPLGTPEFAITSNGGNILVHGEPDEGWSAHVAGLLGGLGAGIDEVHRRLDSDSRDTDWLRTLRIADGLFCYVVVELDLLPPDVVPRWASWAAEVGWNVSRQGRKVYVMPDPVTKHIAVEEVRRRMPVWPRVSLAAGDGVLDQPMLVGSDAAIRPRHGELEELGWQHPDVAVTTGRGLAASEEMLEWLIARTGTVESVVEPDIPPTVPTGADGTNISIPNEGLR